jgi:DNA-binding MarR family transcriptional regulator
MHCSVARHADVRDDETMTKKKNSDRSLGPTLDFMRALWALAHGLETKSKSMHAELGITGPQRLTIRVLGRRPGATPSELADLLSLHRSTVTGIVHRLEQRGLVRKVKNTEDGRRYHLHLTAAGQRVDAPRKGTVESSVQRVLSRHGEKNVAKLRDVLLEIATELESEE